MANQTHTFETTLSAFDFNHWQYHFPVPDEVSAKLIDGNHRRVLVWIESEGHYHMALMKSKTYWYVLVNQELSKKFKMSLGQAFTLIIEKDNSDYGHEMPEELQVLMDQDEEGANYFNSLTPGKQRMMVYTVTKVKSPESRMKKALAIIHHLKLVKGKLDYKQLNELIKHYNNL